MSRERARRREARQAAAAAAREADERRRVRLVAQRRRRTSAARSLRRALGVRPTRVRSATRRAAWRRWLPVLLVAAAGHLLLWLLLGDARASVAALVVTLVAAPLVWVLVTDSSRRWRSGYRRRP